MQDRNFQMSRRPQALLAPQADKIPAPFYNVRESEDSHQRLLHDMQRLRGRVALSEGAIRPYELTPDGRHEAAIDKDSWHLLTLDERGRVGGCVRLRMHSPWTRFEDLGVSRSALARCSEWGLKLRTCVEAQLAQARRQRVPFVEIGGWVLTEQMRHSMEALRIALGAFAIGHLFGGAHGITTATTRNHSSSILGRIGGKGLMFGDMPLPGYYEPQYQCEMKILSFQAEEYDNRYDSKIARLADQLAMAPVYKAASKPAEWMVAANVHSGVLARAAAV